MKKILLALFLVSFVGCAFLKDQKLNWDACKADAACLEQANKWKATGEFVGGIAGSAVPAAAMPTQKAAGWIAFGIAMLVGGHALNKKKEEK